MVIDVRFLKNPHWDPDLRPLDGRDPAVRGFVEADPSYAPFYGRLADLLTFLLPAYRAEGKSYFSLASAAPAAGTGRSRWSRRWRKRLRRLVGGCLFGTGTWSVRPAPPLRVGMGTA